MKKRLLVYSIFMLTNFPIILLFLRMFAITRNFIQILFVIANLAAKNVGLENKFSNSRGCITNLSCKSIVSELFAMTRKVFQCGNSYTRQCEYKNSLFQRIKIIALQKIEIHARAKL